MKNEQLEEIYRRRAGDNFISLTIDHLTEEKIFELLDSLTLDLE